MEGFSKHDQGYFEAQQQPPYQQPYQPQYQQYPYKQPYQPPGYGPPPGPPIMPPQRTSRPLIAGILLIIAGMEGIIMGGILAALGGTFAASMGGLPGGEEFGVLFVVCGIIFMIFGILALIGGIMSATRKNWTIALVGSIFGLFCLGLIFFEASILSLVALILIAISKDEFQ